MWSLGFWLWWFVFFKHLKYICIQILETEWGISYRLIILCKYQSALHFVKSLSLSLFSFFCRCSSSITSILFPKSKLISLAPAWSLYTLFSMYPTRLIPPSNLYRTQVQLFKKHVRFSILPQCLCQHDFCYLSSSFFSPHRDANLSSMPKSHALFYICYICITGEIVISVFTCK